MIEVGRIFLGACFCIFLFLAIVFKHNDILNTVVKMLMIVMTIMSGLYLFF